MKKLIMQFDCDTSLDEDEFKKCLDGPKACCALAEMDEWLRRQLKYEELPEGAVKVLEEAREELRSLSEGLIIW